MKTLDNLSLSVVIAGNFFLSIPSSRAEVVGMIDVGGNVEISNELGSFSRSAMQDLIDATSDLEIAGVLDAEGTFGAGDFSGDTGALSNKISGAIRYGRNDGAASKASGIRWGFINGSTPEIWTPSPGLYHFGFITTPFAPGNVLTVVVTYSDGTTATEIADQPGVTTWIGFYKPGQTITSIAMSEVDGAAFANYDDVSLAFVEAPPAIQPEISITEATSGTLSISFTGILQKSHDLEDWADVEGAVISPVEIPTDEGASFYRSRLPE